MPNDVSEAVADLDQQAIRGVIERQIEAWNRHGSTLSLSAPPEMRQIAPDVVLVVKSVKIDGVGLTPGGTPYPSDGAVMTVVLLKTPDGWRITHAHNTNINAMAVAHDPAK